MLGAQAGQRMVVEMSTSNASTYFNIFAPGDMPGASAAMYIAATNGLRYEGVLPTDGDYLIQVFINRNAARRNETSSYTLIVSIGGEAPAQDFADGLSGGPDFWEVTGVTQSLNIRSEPSTNGAIMAELPKGSVVQNLGCQMNEGRKWCQIRQVDGDIAGWAAGEFLREAAAPATGAETGAASQTGAEMIVTGVPANDTLNVRSGPGTANEVIGELGNGDAVLRLGCQEVGDTRWCEIEMMTDMRECGWVAARYLSDAAQDTAPSSTSGGDFDARGMLPCAASFSAPMTNCDFGVVRKGGGTAIVTVFLPDGVKRVLHFQSGEPIMVENGGDLTSNRRGDLTTIEVDGKERYEVPDAIIFGG